MMEVGEGRDTDGEGSPGMVEEKGPSLAEATASGSFSPEGRDTDGAGSEGMVAENSRVQQGGEGATTRFGMEDGGADTDGAGTQGMAHEEPADGNQSPGPDSSGN